MSLNLGDLAPNFTADTTLGMINFYEWMNDSWTILLSHPKDFTPVCTTELLWISQNYNKFLERNLKIISLSVDKLIHHSKWLDDIKTRYNVSVNIPIISDKNLRIAKLYSMINNHKNKDVVCSTARSIYIISPNKLIMSVVNYPINTGRNFNEILRLVDSLLVTANNNIATPVNWSLGEKLVTANRDAENEEFLGYPKEVEPQIKSINDYMSPQVIKQNIAC